VDAVRLVSAYSRCVARLDVRDRTGIRACDLPQQPFGLSRGYFRTDAFDRPPGQLEGRISCHDMANDRAAGRGCGAEPRCRALTRSPNNLSGRDE